MAVPRFSTGKTSMGTTATSGSSTPEAAACSTRPQMSKKKVGDSAHNAVPMAKVPVAAKKSLRVLKRSMRNAETGTMMPLTSG